MHRLLTAALAASAACGRVAFDAPVDADALAPGLVMHWRLDETDGTTALDSAGAAHGTLMNIDPSTAWVSGHPGTNGGLQLDGIDDYVAVPPRTLVRGSYTIAFWVQLHDWSNNAGDNAWSAVLGPETAWQWFVMVHHQGVAGRLSHYGRLNGSNNHFIAGYLEWGTWYHAALVSDGTTSRWYLDGTLAAESTTHDSTYADIDVLASKYTGASASVRFKGVLDDVRVYNRALAATDISDLYEWTEGAAAR